MNAKRLGLKEFTVNFGAFDFSFVCLIGPYDHVEKYVRWKFEDNDTLMVPEAQQAYAARGRYFYRPGYVPILWLPRRPRTPREHGTLAHECLHMVKRLMDWAAIPPSEDTEEAYCHALGHAVKEILEALR